VTECKPFIIQLTILTHTIYFKNVKMEKLVIFSVYMHGECSNVKRYTPRVC